MIPLKMVSFVLSNCVCVCVRACVRVCVCVRERERVVFSVRYSAVAKLERQDEWLPRFVHVCCGNCGGEFSSGVHMHTHTDSQ